MKAFDTENSVWARFSPEQRGQMEAYSIHYRQPGQNGWPIRKSSARLKTPDSGRYLTSPA